jgi:hypothetical protein
MAILYIFKLNDTQNVGPFPPSVIASDWFKTMYQYIELYSYTKTADPNTAIFLFPNQAEFDKHLSLKCTDPALLADIEAWKSTYNVSYTSTAYNYDTASPISFTPVVD